MWVEVALSDRNHDQRGAAVDAAAAHETAEVPFHRALPNTQDQRDVAGRSAMGDQPEDIVLPRRQGRLRPFQWTIVLVNSGMTLPKAQVADAGAISPESAIAEANN